MLGSPVGATIAHFLIQHKSVLGNKHIQQIYLFRDNRPADTDPQPQILFWIGDVDPDEVNDDDDTDMPDTVGKRCQAITIENEDSSDYVRVHTVMANTSASEWIA